MGTNFSSVPDRAPSPDPWWQQNKSMPSVNAIDANNEAEESFMMESDDCTPTQNDTVFRREVNQKKLEVFKHELALKREARKNAIAALTDRLNHLQQQVNEKEEARIKAENEISRLKTSLMDKGLLEELEEERRKVTGLEKELDEEKRVRLELENQKEEINEKDRQIHALKEVASIGKEMLRIRELQVNELRKKLCETQYPGDLREEYEAQIENVKRLKHLYEERAEAVRIEHRREIEKELAKIRVLEGKITRLEREREDAESMREHLKSRVLKLDKELEEKTDAAMSMQEQLDTSIIECRELASQMNLINGLFSQMLVGNVNIDRVTRLVEENQNLFTDLTADDKKNDLATAALLIDIAKRLEDDDLRTELKSDESDTSNSGNNVETDPVEPGTMSQQDVAVNLSKVWKILVHLSTNDDKSPQSDCDSDKCYKCVETPSGKRSVISVSQTFLTLKELILEKNSLIKEVGKLKHLNEHLETRLGNQEKRLTTVSTELKKTWGVVSELRAQHRQLHTQEKILKYELQLKRSLLTDLKDELERCKEIWDMARKKNCQSEEEWRKLRKEFADRRKNRQISNSAESGYEDDDSNSPPSEDTFEDRMDDSPASTIINDESTTENEVDSGNYYNCYGETSTQSDCDDNNNSGSDEISKTCSEVTSISDESCLRLTETAQAMEQVGALNEVISDNSLDNNEVSSHVPEVENDSHISLPISEKEIDTSHSPSVFVRPSLRQSSTEEAAQNISKFLDGLLAPDVNDTSESTEHVKDFSNENEEPDITSTSIQSPVDHIDMTLNEISDTVNTCKKIETLSESHLKPDENISPCPPEMENVSAETSGRVSGNQIPVSDKVSCDETTKNPKETRTAEEVLTARTERLKRLEEQCKSLFDKVTATTVKSHALSSKLESLHEHYGRSTESTIRHDTTSSTDPSQSDDRAAECDIETTSMEKHEGSS